MPKLKVDGIEVEVPQGATVLQACEAAGKEIPRFCYHERLSIAGNCRMCLVEVKPGPPKPQASCALPAADNQEVFTTTPMVKKAREGVMEFLLINHPLDCPICDQGGECDLQDQSVAYGKGHSRYTENKRAVTEKYMGPIVKTIMTRCIQCTRCVRFAEEVAGVEEIGAIYRGEDMQITSYLEQAVTSELSGNVVDLCPVGALTSKPYAYEARPWELKKTLTIDVQDAVGTNIRLDSRGRQVLRCVPRINEDVNEEWAHDKTRHHVDGLVRRRLDRPYVRRDGKLVAVSWDEAFGVIKDRVAAAGSNVAAVAGDLVDCETMYAAKALLATLGSTKLEGRQTGMDYDTSSLAAVNFNTTIAGVEQADARIVSLATPPTAQSAPNLMISLALALFLGTAAATGAVIIANAMQTGLSGPDDIERRLGVGAVGERGVRRLSGRGLPGRKRSTRPDRPSAVTPVPHPPPAVSTLARPAAVWQQPAGFFQPEIHAGGRVHRDCADGAPGHHLAGRLDAAAHRSLLGVELTCGGTETSGLGDRQKVTDVVPVAQDVRDLGLLGSGRRYHRDNRYKYVSCSKFTLRDAHGLSYTINCAMSFFVSFIGY